MLAACGPPVDTPQAAQDHTDVTVDTGWAEVEQTGCVPDDDPALSVDELTPDLDLVAQFLGARADVNPDDGWDFSGIGQTPMLLSWADPSGLWFGEHFPGATHAGTLDLDGENWAIYRSDDDGLWLLGVASATPDFTRLSYSPAVRLWTYPLGAGDSIDSEVAAEGMYEGDTYPMDVGWGNEIHLVHSYSVAATGAGHVTVDAGTYAAQRVSIEFEAVGLDNYDIEYGRKTAQSWLFLSACVGTVARITEGEFMGLGL
jgi:hypothetical protein